MMIWTIFEIFLNWTSSPKFSKKLLPLVSSRIQSWPLSNSLSSSLQSAYRMFQFTETTLVSIHSLLLLSPIDRCEVTSPILLDLSAAFDTVDHFILNRLQTGLVSMALLSTGFHLVLTSRSQRQSPCKIPLSGGSRGATGGHGPPKRWTIFFSHLVIQITDRIFE